MRAFPQAHAHATQHMKNLSAAITGTFMTAVPTDQQTNKPQTNKQTSRPLPPATVRPELEVQPNPQIARTGA